jgi:hypothetical protein
VNQLVRLAFSYVLHHAFAQFWYALLSLFELDSESEVTSRAVECAWQLHAGPL